MFWQQKHMPKKSGFLTNTNFMSRLMPNNYNSIKKVMVQNSLNLKLVLITWKGIVWWVIRFALCKNIIKREKQFLLAQSIWAIYVLACCTVTHLEKDLFSSFIQLQYFGVSVVPTTKVNQVLKLYRQKKAHMRSNLYLVLLLSLFLLFFYYHIHYNVLKKIVKHPT